MHLKTHILHKKKLILSTSLIFLLATPSRIRFCTTQYLIMLSYRIYSLINNMSLSCFLKYLLVL